MVDPGFDPGLLGQDAIALPLALPPRPENFAKLEMIMFYSPALKGLLQSNRLSTQRQKKHLAES